MIQGDAITYRLATDADGPAIGKLFRAADYQDHGVDWERAAVGSWWIVAEREGEMRGAILVTASKPFGFIGEVVVHPDERGKRADQVGSLAKRPGAIGYRLYMQALMWLQDAGVEIVMGIIHEELTGLQKIMRHYGATEIGKDYRLYGMRLTTVSTEATG